MRRAWSLLAATLLAGSTLGCAARGPSASAVLSTSAELGEGPAAERALNQWLSETARTLPARSHERGRVWARLAELCAIRAARDPRFRLGPCAERVAPASDPLVASVYHARQALAALPAGEALRLPRLRLELVELIALTRLGFEEELLRHLAALPGLAEAGADPAVLDAWEVPGPLRAWVAYVLHRELRPRDELAAFRFAVLAIEGAERFDASLPAERVHELETWITSGSGVRFVCPESGTPFLPGARRSPISGVPQLEYVPVPRTR